MRRTTLALAVGVLVLAACSSSSDEGTESTTPRASASGVTDASPTGWTVADLVGTWRGDVIQPNLHNTVWATEVTIKECDEGELCGHERGHTDDLDATGEPETCVYALEYYGLLPISYYDIQPDHPSAFMFEEHLRSGESGDTCVEEGELALTPLQDWATLGYESYWEGQWGSYGVLRLDTDS